MSQLGMITTVIATNIAEAVEKDENNEGCDISAGLFGVELSQVVRDLAQECLVISHIEALKEKAEHLINACSLHGFGDIDEVDEMVKAISLLPVTKIVL
jgi:hypothetical protein